MWSHQARGAGQRSRSLPSMHKTQGVLSTIQILPSELPSVQAGRSPPVFAFKQKINRALKARLAAWEVQVRTAISDQLTGRLEANPIAEERDTQLHRHTRCTVTLEPRQPRQCMVIGGDSATQSLPGNVHLEHASDSGPTGLSGRRLTQAAEGRALQWASLGVTHMSNLKSHHQDQEGRPVATY